MKTLATLLLWTVGIYLFSAAIGALQIMMETL